MRPRTIIIYCGLLMSSAAFSTDIVLPSFPAIETGLATSNTLVQWTISAFMMAAGAGQVVWGGVSDRFGRRAALGVGLAIYFAGCLLAVFTPSIELLLAARALQGFGAASAMVSSRAIIRDLHSGDDLAHNLALATAIFAAGPILAPLLGGVIEELSGWRMTFGALAAYGGLLLVAVAALPETIASKTADATRLATIIRRTRRMLAHPQSRHFLVFSAITNSAMFLILASLPVIYDVHFGVTGFAFSVFFAIHGLGIVVGQIGNRRLIRSRGTVPAMITGGIILVVTGVLITAGAVLDLLNAYSLSAVMILYATSYMIVYSNASSMVLDPHGDIAGFAAAVFGFCSQVGGALIVSVIVLFTGSSITAFGVALFSVCLASLAGTLWWRAGARERLNAT